MLLSLIGILAILAAVLLLYTRQPKFGQQPDAAHLKRIQASPHYRDGRFHNLIPTPRSLKKAHMCSALFDLLLPRKMTRPPWPLPSVTTEIAALDPMQDTVIWLGHSSFFIQMSGKRILVDPVLSSNASPIPGTITAFAGTNRHAPEAMPDMDALLITHDHWDHLDHASVVALRPRIRMVLCGLGVGAHFKSWGYAASCIQELDWLDSFSLSAELTIHMTPSRHYGGRLSRNSTTLWGGFVLATPTRRIFISGDSGYGPHFKSIGERFSGFDLAIMENGQYDSRWPHVHMCPEETAQAAEDVRAAALLPSHAGKFSIAYHTWDEPFSRIAAASATRPYRLLTPMLGEPVHLDMSSRMYPRWWEPEQKSG